MDASQAAAPDDDQVGERRELDQLGHRIVLCFECADPGAEALAKLARDGQGGRGLRRAVDTDHERARPIVRVARRTRDQDGARRLVEQMRRHRAERDPEGARPDLRADHDERRIASIDLRQPAVTGISLEQPGLDCVHGLGLGATALERDLRVVEELLGDRRHLPAGMDGDRGVVGRDERERSVGRLADEAGVRLVGDWIRSLPVKGGRDAEVVAARKLAAENVASLKELRGNSRREAVAKLLSTMNGSLALLNEAVEPALRDEVAAAAAADTNALVRDLFQRLLPPDRRRRTLGNDFDPQRVLALPGDAARGRELFLGVSQCARCHVCNGAGRAFGPDLSRRGLLTGLGAAGAGGTAAVGRSTLGR